MASAIENSIRRAIAKGDGDDPDFRVLVYEAAERAIIRGEADGKTTSDESDQRRRELIAAVEAIEAGYPPAERGESIEGEHHPDAGSPSQEIPEAAAFTADETASGVPAPDGVSIAGRPANAMPSDSAGEVEKPSPREEAEPKAQFDAERGTQSASQSASRPAKPADRWTPGARRKGPGTARYPKRIVAIVIVALLAFLLIIGAYLILPFLLPNLFASTPHAESNVDPIAAAIRSASTDGATGVAGGGWTTAFAADGTKGVEAGPRGTVSAVTASGERAAVRITAKTPANGDDPAVVAALIVAAGTVAEFAGHTVRGELTVGSPDGVAREFTVSCHIADQSICGRQRFSTKLDSQSFVFDMEIPQAATGEAKLSVDPALGSGANDLNVFALRLKNA